MQRLRHGLAPIFICGLFTALFASDVKAAQTCRPLWEQYQAVRSLHLTMYEQFQTRVLDSLQRRTCSLAGLQFLDSYAGVLRAYGAAAGPPTFPCDDKTTHNGEVSRAERDTAKKILGDLPAARRGCLSVLDAPPIYAPPASTDGIRSSSSCSDITGTDDHSQARSDCNAAGHSLIAARNTRNISDTSEGHYKKAAASYRKAGDISQAEMTLLEMASPPINYPDQDEKRLSNLTDAAFEQNTAKAIEKANPTSCDGRGPAAAHYDQAAELFQKARELEQAAEMRRKSNEMNSCQSKVAAPVQRPPNKDLNPPPDKCKEALAAVEHLEKLAEFQESMTTAGTKSEDAEKLRKEATAQRSNLASQGCK